MKFCYLYSSRAHEGYGHPYDDRYTSRDGVYATRAACQSLLYRIYGSSGRQTGRYACLTATVSRKPAYSSFLAISTTRTSYEISSAAPCASSPLNTDLPSSDARFFSRSKVLLRRDFSLFLISFCVFMMSPLDFFFSVYIVDIRGSHLEFH